jgi:protein involved in polysaccharide export with SLBB domain
LEVQITDDPWLSASVVVDGAGSADVPGCGALLVAGLETHEVQGKIATCLVSSGAYEERPQVLLTNVHRAGSVTLIVGTERKSRAVPFEPGMTLVSALATGLVIAPGHHPHRIVLRRKDKPYDVNLQAILGGLEADEPVERGDEILVEAEVPIRPEESSDARTSTARFASNALAGAAPEKTECGELLLEDIGLHVLRLGEHHPHVARIREAIVNRCSTETAASSLRDACRRAREDQSAASRSYGPMHPRIRTLNAQLEICPPPDVDVAGTPRADCASLRAQREALIASRKGARHPLVVALDVRLEGCR